VSFALRNPEPRTGVRWDVRDIPDQTGRVAIVTGANSGIGFETAAALAEHGAVVVLACRNRSRGQQAAQQIAARTSEGAVETVTLDLADLESVRRAADELSQEHVRIDLLINNAGVAWPPHTVASTGAELQFAVNHLGHYALTCLLLPRLLATPDSRVVTVTSSAHRVGSIDLDDLACARHYRPFRAYARSKLANLMFTFELQRRLERNGSATAALGAHPGGSRTELIRNPLLLPAGRLRALFQFQPASMGALPTLRAGTDPAAKGGEVYGPQGLLELRGHPKRVGASRRAHDVRMQQELWSASGRLAGIVSPV
jgi:NAD(P)-dependent dehydrogenase (short-subunit alcohol dehydrogenase family)